MKICIDFETTGIPRGLNYVGIVQIAAMKWSPISGGVGGIEQPLTYQTLINPECDWEDGAIKVHGITPEMVKDAPTFFQAFHDFANFVTGCDEWIGYNPEFDVKVLQMSLDQYGFTTHFPWPVKRTDVMQMAAEHMNIQGRSGLKNPKLSEIYEHLFKEKLDGAHDAMVDVQATIDVLMELQNV